MREVNPARILITGGHEIGGIASFAEGLRAGFAELGIPAEIVPPKRILGRWRDLRDPQVLKILSTTAVFAAPFARRAICMVHGVPCAAYQGWPTFLSLIGSFKLANRCSGVQLISVSYYTAATLRAAFNVRTDAIIHNPAKAIYFEANSAPPQERCYITYVGRLVAQKNIHRILPAVRILLNEIPGMRMCIIGQGEQRMELEALAGGDPRFEFKGAPDDMAVRELLRRSKVFVSANEIEGFGIAYVEAMTQGCAVVMPAGGGGLEIAPELIGDSVYLLPLSWDIPQMVVALRRATQAQPKAMAATPYRPLAVAEAYLRADGQFNLQGLFHSEAE